MTYKLLVVSGALLAGLVTFTPIRTFGVDCPGQPNDLVKIALDWCSRDHGFNEGATCGLNALGNAGLTGLPGMASQTVLGNTWDRTNMMGATLVAAKAGQMDTAVEAAICCQIHNGPVRACLEKNKGEVAGWLRSH